MEWYFLVLLSACFLASADLFMKKALTHDHALEFLLSSSFLITLFLLPFLSQMNFSFSIFSYNLIFLKALLASLAWLLFMKGVRHLELSQAIPLKNLSSLYVLILSFFFLGGRLTFLQIGGILILIFGAALLELEKDLFHFVRKIKELPKKYLFFILIGLLFGAFCVLLDKIILREVEVLSFTFLHFLLLFLFYFGYSTVRYQGYQDMIAVYKKSGIFVFGFAISMVFADYLHFSALAIPTVYISLAIPLRRLGSLISTFIGGRMFHEHNLGLRFLASSFMLSGVGMLVW